MTTPTPRRDPLGEPEEQARRGESDMLGPSSRPLSATERTTRGFFSNPWVGFVGTVASVVGTLLAICFYRASLRDPDLVYTVGQTRSVIVQKDRPSGLKVDFDGTVIDKTDVVVMHVSIWNAGRESIRPDNVLEPVFIEVGGGARLLTATAVKSARRLSALKLTPDPSGGRVGVTWSILEFNDGISVQLVYAGPVDAPVRVVGTIEHQGQVRLTVPLAEQNQKWWEVLFNAVVGLVATLTVLLLVGIWIPTMSGSGRAILVTIFVVGLLVTLAHLSVAAATLYRYLTSVTPPFGP